MRYLLALLIAAPLWAVQPVLTDHELARIVVDPLTNAAVADLRVPGLRFDRLVPPGNPLKPQFFVTVECLYNAEDPRAWSEPTDLPIQWRLQYPDGSLDQSEQLSVPYECKADRKVTIDIGPVMPRAFGRGALFTLWIWPPTASLMRHARVIRWVDVGMNYETDLPEPVPGPAGPQGPQGDTGPVGPAGADCECNVWKPRGRSSK